MKNITKVLKLDEYSITPKYVQLVNGFISAIEQGHITKGDLLPSINDLSCALEISRNTIERVYAELKKSGIVNSVPGKGVFVHDTDFKRPLKILLLFNKLSSHKKLMYDSMVEHLGSEAAIDFYIYNNDFSLFKKILAEKLSYDYSKFVIVPHFIDNEEKANDIINLIPKDKLVLCDKLLPEIKGEYAAVYEDFEYDIYMALSQLIDQLIKYKIIKIIFPKNSYYSRGIINGFRDFCIDKSFEYQIIDSMENEIILPGTVYINLMEDDLVLLLSKIMDLKLQIGKDIGLISYNETAIKKLILDGLTTISTDFRLLGLKTAEMILSNERTHFAVPFTVNSRNSL